MTPTAYTAGWLAAEARALSVDLAAAAAEAINSPESLRFSSRWRDAGDADRFSRLQLGPSAGLAAAGALTGPWIGAYEGDRSGGDGLLFGWYDAGARTFEGIWTRAHQDSARVWGEARLFLTGDLARFTGWWGRAGDSAERRWTGRATVAAPTAPARAGLMETALAS